MADRPGIASPMIGLTVSSRATAEQRAEYRLPLERLGAVVVELMPGGEQAGIEGLDGLLLAGGGDVGPGRYGQAPHPMSRDIDPARDDLELRLVAQALKAGVPVLGICRGAQVLGVALGGSLVQDIPALVGSKQDHAGGRHEIKLADHSGLREMLGCARIEVNSFHHQANNALGSRTRATAWADDGVVEAIEAEGDGFVIGVQWHPERMLDDERQPRLFAAFVGASAERARRSGEREA